MSDYPYPNINQTPYSQQPHQGYPQNQTYNQGNYQGQGYNEYQGYPQNQPNYSMGYNNPMNPNYEVFNGRYSGRQRWVIMGIVFLFTCIVVGVILFISRSMKSNQRYPNYY